MPAAPGVHQPCAMATQSVGGFPASSWSSFFQKYPRLVLLLKPWVSLEMKRFFGVGSLKACMLTTMILDMLPVYGLDEGILVGVLRPTLRSHTLKFVQRLLEAAEKRCMEKLHKLLLRKDRCADKECWAEFSWWQEGSPVASTSWKACQERCEGNLVVRTTSSGSQHRGEWIITTRVTRSDLAGGQELSPEPSLSPAACTLETPVCGAAPSSSAEAADADALPSPSSAAGQGGPACVPAPIPAEQEDAQQEPGQAVPAASAPRRSTRKRRPGSSQDSAAPAMKLPRQ